MRVLIFLLSTLLAVRSKVTEIHTEVGVITHYENEEPPQKEAMEVARRLATGAQTLTQAEKQQILDTHNTMRRDIATGAYSSEPKATNMYKLMWDPALETVATNYAAGCYWLHNPNMDTDYSNIASPPRRTSAGVGENLAVSYGGSSFPSDIPTWIANRMSGLFNEYPDYTYSSNTCAANKMCGHYTQIVWSSTLYVGCGYAFCPTMTNGYSTSTPKQTFSNAAFFVCNYAPPGNYRGVKPYISGNTCSGCPSGSQCCNQLCDTGGAEFPGGATNQCGPLPTVSPTQPTPPPTPRPTTSGQCNPWTTSGSGTFYCGITSATNVEYESAIQSNMNCFISVTATKTTQWGAYDKVSFQMKAKLWYSNYNTFVDAVCQTVLNMPGVTAGAAAGAPPAPAPQQQVTSGNPASTTAKKPDNTGVIVGSIVGALAVCVLGAACVWYAMKQKRASDEYNMMQEQRTDYNPPQQQLIG